MKKRLLLIVLCLGIFLICNQALAELKAIGEKCPDGISTCQITTSGTYSDKTKWTCVTIGECVGSNTGCCKPKTADATTCTSPNTCNAITMCPTTVDQITAANPDCLTKDATKPICCKPKCEPANCRDKCDGTFEPDPSRSVNGCTDPAKKACCKPKGGTTDPSTGGGKTEGGTYPLAPLSPVGDINIPTLIGLIIKGVLGIVGSIALLMFVYGGFLMLISQGDAAKIKKGKDALVWAAAGLVVIFGSYIFVNYILTNLSKGGS